jgi:hypothetical protein
MGNLLIDRHCCLQSIVVFMDMPFSCSYHCHFCYYLVIVLLVWALQWVTLSLLLLLYFCTEFFFKLFNKCKCFTMQQILDADWGI